MRLIDADALIGSLHQYGFCDGDDRTMVYKVIRLQPTIEPERKRGKWIKPKGMMPPEHHGHYECSECGAWAGRDWLKPWKEIQLTNFCPNCGAEMRGEQDGRDS